MDKAKILIPLFVILIVGCVTISFNSRMENFENISKAYEKALSASDFETAYQFIDPQTIEGEMGFDKYKNIKVVEYEVKKSNLSGDNLEIYQIVEIGYYKLSSYVLRTIRHKELWKYNEENKSWLLQTSLPDFK
ncbi:MAG TPA: hypothetical protein VMW42_10920 [Desulfatiglandales bacterium]|nr:hypothetical protein [Desulfatiglandales bacterium]